MSIVRRLPAQDVRKDVNKRRVSEGAMDDDEDFSAARGAFLAQAA